ncbi:hypothetical protein IEQ34_001776 [Dendrobium chrysotoxum]|uniref:Uncharacterized protein n=1 Tax=Dendrobium chrysotoxum TaxID=161865 RepID=A0AAV7HQ54_DENCH|nr:hypothetical protein IEQ34_001776 [Dendrobium chrysotoxum]
MIFKEELPEAGPGYRRRAVEAGRPYRQVRGAQRSAGVLGDRTRADGDRAGRGLRRAWRGDDAGLGAQVDTRRMWSELDRMSARRGS